MVPVVRISKYITLRFEHKPGGLNFILHSDRVDSVQRVGISKPRIRLRHMIDDEKDASGLQGSKERPVQSRDVGGAEEGVV